MTLFPNDFVSFSTGKVFGNELVALEPRESSLVVSKASWPSAQIVQAIDDEIRLVNNTLSPIFIPKNEQLCQIRSTHIINNNGTSGPSVSIR